MFLLGAPQVLGRSVSDVRVELVLPELSRKQKGKIAAHGVAEPSCGGGGEGQGWVGQGCSQFTKKFDFVNMIFMQRYSRGE